MFQDRLSLSLSLFKLLVELVMWKALMCKSVLRRKGNLPGHNLTAEVCRVNLKREELFWNYTIVESFSNSTHHMITVVLCFLMTLHHSLLIIIL